MATSNKFDYISLVYRYRLLFRTEVEYREALGVSYETIVNNRESDRDMSMYFGVLAQAAKDKANYPLQDFVDAYVSASEMYRTIDWGDRTQMASRRKFCRMLFRLYATAGKELSAEELFKFKIKDDDNRLLKAFFPDGPEGSPAVDISLITLFAFGVLRPHAAGARGRDIGDKETNESLRKLRALIDALKDDMLRLGSTEKPLAFDDWLSALDNLLEGNVGIADCTPLWLYASLFDISRACRSLVIAENRHIGNEGFCGVHLYGIWIDDGDCGASRFWIFPDNCSLAFCYEFDGFMWRLSPYEFRVRFGEDAEKRDSFIFVTPNGNLTFALSPNKAIGSEDLVKGSVGGEADEKTGEVNRVAFYDDLNRFPDWFNWRVWERLSRDDARYQRYHSLLKDFYNPNSPGSMFLQNVAPELTDAYNTLVGRDHKYLYVYDWQPRKCVLREADEDKYVYAISPDEELPSGAIFELEISEEHPLYAIPLDIAGKSYRNREMDWLADILSGSDYIKEAYIQHSSRAPLPRLVFPTYGGTICIEKHTLDELGIIKFTKSVL